MIAHRVLTGQKYLVYALSKREEASSAKSIFTHVQAIRVRTLNIFFPFLNSAQRSRRLTNFLCYMIPDDTFKYAPSIY